MGQAAPERRHRIAYAAGAVLTVAFLVAAVVTQADEIGEAKWDFAAGWLALSIAALALFHVANGEIWRLLLADLGGTLDARRARSIWSTTVLARYVPTGALAVVGRAALAGRYGVSRAVVVASAVYELFLALAAGLLLGAYFVIGLPELDGEPARYAVLPVGVASLAVVHPAVFRRLSAIGLRRLGREALPRVLPARHVAGYLAAYVASLGVAGLATYAFARSLHSVDGADVPVVLCSFAVAFAIALLAFVLPGGLGAREAAMAAALSGALPFAVAVAVAIGVRLAQILVEVAYALIASALARGAVSAAVPSATGDGSS